MVHAQIEPENTVVLLAGLPFIDGKQEIVTYTSSWSKLSPSKKVAKFTSGSSTANLLNASADLGSVSFCCVM